MTEFRPLRAGDEAPGDHGRTDEGTPVSLADFKGRNTAVFLIGEGLERSKRTALKAIAQKTQELLDRECSPVAVSAEPFETINSFRTAEELPYLIISDTTMNIHRALAGEEAEPPYGSWIFDEDGKLVATVPPMKIRELITATVAAVDRLFTDRG